MYGSYGAIPDPDKLTLGSAFKRMPNAYKFEDKLFGWTMYVLYITAGAILQQLIFPDWPSKVIMWFIEMIACHMGYSGIKMGDAAFACH